MATVPGVFLDGTRPVAPAGVACVGTDASSEEALAGLAAEDAKVVSRGGVTTDLAQGML